jgi:hypothetical protein
MRPGPLTSPTAATKATLWTLARRWQQLQAELDRLDRQLQELVAAAALAGRAARSRGRHRRAAAGDGWRQPQRLRSEAAFAHLCGTAPIPASSGRTHRHRRNRGGDRRANHALWGIALVRMHCHPPTRVYVQQRTNQGLSKLDIMRWLKRDIAREVYHHLTSPPPTTPTPLPEIGGIDEPHQHGHDGAERQHASPVSRLSHRLIELATGPGCASMGPLRRPTTSESWKTDDSAGPTGRARIRAHQEANLRLRRLCTYSIANGDPSAWAPPASLRWPPPWRVSS